MTSEVYRIILDGVLYLYLFQAFGPDVSQEEVYSETTKKLVENVLEGYNATVFAYGATGPFKEFNYKSITMIVFASL